MPVIPSKYRPPVYYQSAHLSTLVPGLFRKVTEVSYTRERIGTNDGDFLDLDWSRKGSDRVIILSHGLEGNSDRAYIKGMVRYMNQKGWDALAWNCRSCSGEMNKLPRFYHHADAEDLAEVVSFVADGGEYREIMLVGFSMGGNMILKYLGENPSRVPGQVCGAAVFSVPVNLRSSVDALGRWPNHIYRNRFLRKLEHKIRLKSELFPEQIRTDNWEEIRHFPDFDNRYTAPLHGFKDADDFYSQASCTRHLKGIEIPVLLVNAINDPFLGKECYPEEICRTLSNVYLEMPRYGGHVGFSLNQPVNYMELRTNEFYEQTICAN